MNHNTSLSYEDMFGFDIDKAIDIAAKTVQHAQAIDGLNVNNLSDDIDLLVQQDFSQCTIIFNSIFEYFLKEIHAAMPFAGEIDSDEELAKNLDVVFNEEMISRCRFLLRRVDEPQSLNNFTKVACKDDDPNLARKRRNVREKFAIFEELWVWKIEEKKQSSSTERYEISAGPALRIFGNHVYTPLRIERIRHISERLQ